MANTTSFGWDTPDDTDLVKDGAAAIRELGQDIDTSMTDLLGGTSGQILSKASGTNMDFTWIDQNTGDITGVTAGTGISGGGTSGTVTVTNSMATAIDAKGDLIAGTGADAFARLAVGTNGQVLMADSAETNGLKWGTPSAGSLTYVGGASFTGSSSQSLNNVFTSTYANYMIVCNIDSVSTGANINFRLRASGTDSGASYYSNIMYNDLSSGGVAFGSIGVSNGAAWKIADLSNTGSPYGFSFNLFNPQRSVTTTFESGSHGYNYSGIFYQSFCGGVHNVASSYDGITISPAAGSFTGNIRVYGIANS
jgi:hypothetical protein